MRSVLLMTIKNIKKKKLQSSLIFLIILLASLIFSTSFVMMGGMSSAVEKNHEELNGFDEMYAINSSQLDYTEILDFLKERKDVKEISISKSFIENNKLFLNDRELTFDYFLEEKENKDVGIDKIKIIEGNKDSSPKEGETWIPSAFAKNYNINIGDSISFNRNDKKITLKVSAIVNDPVCNSLMYGVARLWVSSGYLQKIINNKSLLDVINIRLDENKNGDKLYNDISDNIKNLSSSKRFSYSNFETSYNFTYNLLGVFLLVLAILIIIFTTIVIGFTISNMFLSDYKTIGVIEALGFKKVEILFIYIFQFLFLTITSVPIGITLSKVLSKYLLDDSFKELGFGEFNPSIMKYAFVTFLIIMMIIIIGTVISSLKVLKINPVEAIRAGNSLSSSKKKSSISIIKLKKLPISFAIALKNIFGNKKETSIMFLLMFMCFYFTSFSLNLLYSMKNSGNSSQYWGFGKCDVSILLKEELAQEEINNLIKDIESDYRVNISALNYSYIKSSIGKYKDMPPRNFYIMVYNKFLDELGFDNLKGRNPRGENEVSIAANTSKKYNKDVGDYINLYINGQEKTFLVTGVYQSMMNVGYGFRIDYDALTKLDKEFKNQKFNQINIILKNSNDKEQFISDLRKLYNGKIQVESGNSKLKDFTVGIIGVIGSVCFSVIISFLVMAFVCIFNFTLMGIHQNKKTLGIYKALGVEDKTLIISNVIRILTTGTAALFFALTLEKATEGLIMGGMFSSFGIQKFPLTTDVRGLLIAIPLILVLISISSIIPSRMILKINGKELISE